MEKMIPMTEYVAWLHKKNTQMQPGDKHYGMADCFDKAVIYGIFIENTPTLSMFIPCDDDGEPLVTKVISLKKYQKTLGKIHGDALEHIVDQYEDALENVLFDGWETLMMADRKSFRLHNMSENICHYNATTNSYSWKNNFRTIEDLINEGVILRPTKACIKKYGLPEKVAE